LFCFSAESICDFGINITAQPEAQLYECCTSTTPAVHSGPHISACLRLCKIRPWGI